MSIKGNVSPEMNTTPDLLSSKIFLISVLECTVRPVIMVTLSSVTRRRVIMTLCPDSRLLVAVVTSILFIDCKKNVMMLKLNNQFKEIMRKLLLAQC